jgi:hypothetical protein
MKTKARRRIQIHHSEPPGSYTGAYSAARLDSGYTDKYLNDLYAVIGRLMRRNARRRNYNPTPAALRYLRLVSRYERQEES